MPTPIWLLNLLKTIAWWNFNGRNLFQDAGGKGGNQAVASARLDGGVTLIAKLGNDIFGKQTIEGLVNEQIKTEFILIDDETPSGTAFIIVNEEGEIGIVVALGANANLLPTDIEKIEELSTAEIILMQLEIPMETICFGARIPKKNGLKLVLNPAPVQLLDDELLHGLFLITPNETETKDGSN